MEGGLQPSLKGPKACTTCAKAKARCIPRTDDGEKCERCFRLQKDCFSRAPAPPRPKKRPKRSRVAELEKRLNELSSQFGGHPPRATFVASPKPPVAVSAPSKGSEKGSELLFLEHLFPSPSSSGDDSHDMAWSPEALPAWDSPWPLSAEADVLLLQYHDTFAHLFPFVVIPKQLTAAALRADRPFLWRAFMMVVCVFDGARQFKMGDEILAEVGKAALIDGSKTLDLLQGLELLIAWFYFALKSSQLTNLLFLARSTLFNLHATSTGLGCEPPYSGLDHVRAYVGVYFLNTLVFATNKRTGVLMNMPQLDGYCRMLESTKEYPSDEYLVRFVRVQQLAHDICLTMTFDPAAPAMSLPLAMVVESFKDQLDTFRATLAPHFIEDPRLKCHIAVAEALLMDVAISDEHCNAYQLPATDRLKLLWSCLRSLGGFFETRFAASELERPRFLPVTISDLAYVFITGIKLLTLQLPGWDIDQVGRELALDKMLLIQIQDLRNIIEKRKGGLLSTVKSGLEDPLERLLRLLQTAQELVSLQLTGVSAAEIAQAVMQDMNSGTWQDLVNDPTCLPL